MKSAKGEIRRLNDLMSSTGTNNLISDLEHFHKQVRDLDATLHANLLCMSFPACFSIRIDLSFDLQCALFRMSALSVTFKKGRKPLSKNNRVDFSFLTYQW